MAILALQRALARQIFKVEHETFAACFWFDAHCVPAFAQNVVAVVNSEPVTSFDVTQRTKIIQLADKRTPTRQQVLDQLIDDRLKLQAARRFGMEPGDRDVEQAFAVVGARTGMSSEQFSAALRGAGIEPRALKSRLRADVAWRDLTRARFSRASAVRESDIVQALEKKGQKARGTTYDYQLRQILFVVPQEQGMAGLQARMREAEGLRNRFQDCE